MLFSKLNDLELTKCPKCLRPNKSYKYNYYSIIECESYIHNSHFHFEFGTNLSWYSFQLEIGESAQYFISINKGKNFLKTCIYDDKNKLDPVIELSYLLDFDINNVDQLLPRIEKLIKFL